MGWAIATVFLSICLLLCQAVDWTQCRAQPSVHFRRAAFRHSNADAKQRLHAFLASSPQINWLYAFPAARYAPPEPGP